MTAAALATGDPAASPSQTSYPPRENANQSSRPTLASQTASEDGDDFSDDARRITSYLVHTATESVSDLRLQVTEDPQGSHQAARPSFSYPQHAQKQGASGPPRPLWFRERQLTANDEIMDIVVDAMTGRATWTIHRPVRGWYLHIRSPLLPPGFTIPLRSARPDYVASATGVRDPTSTPLTFSMRTRIDKASLGRCLPDVQEVVEISKTEAVRVKSPNTTQAALADGQDFIAVEVDGTLPSSSAARDKPHQGHTARVSSISYALYGNGTHTRKRSAAGLVAGVLADVTARSQTPSTKAVRPRDCYKVDEQERTSGSQVERASTDALVDPAHQLDPTAARSARSSPREAPSMSQRAANSTECYFLLVDGAASARASPRQQPAGARLAPGRVPEGSHRLGWARWVWSLVPEPVRPPLAFDTAKSFSVRWIDVPSSDSSSPPQGEDRSVEVMRYEDQDGWSLWNSKTHGRFVFQEEAVRALGIDVSFWITVGLAYLEFLEERDGYNAASEG